MVWFIKVCGITVIMTVYYGSRPSKTWESHNTWLADPSQILHVMITTSSLCSFLIFGDRWGTVWNIHICYIFLKNLSITIKATNVISGCALRPCILMVRHTLLEMWVKYILLNWSMGRDDRWLTDVYKSSERLLTFQSKCYRGDAMQQLYHYSHPSPV